MERLCGDLIDHFRNLMIAKTVPTLGELIICTEGELQQIQVEAEGFSMEAILSALDLLQGTLERMRSGVNRRIEMEMALIKLATPTLCSDSAALLRRIEALEQAMRTGRVAVAPQAAPEKPLSFRRGRKRRPPARQGWIHYQLRLMRRSLSLPLPQGGNRFPRLSRLQSRIGRMMSRRLGKKGTKPF